MASHTQNRSASIRLLQGAWVDGSDDRRVEVRYADGGADTWTLDYRGARWVVDYTALPEDSPLRVSTNALQSWKSEQLTRRAALARYTPRFEPTDDAALEIADRAIGAVFDPIDGTVWVAVFDVDRTTAGVFHIDPEAHAVLRRIPLSPPKEMTLVGGWFTRWHAALSPSGAEMALSVPGRIWRVDLETGRSRIAARTGRVTALSWGRTADGSEVMVWGTESGTVTVDGTPTAVPVTGQPVLAWLGGEQLVVATDRGELTTGSWREPVSRTTRTVCEATVLDAAVRPDGSEVLLACGHGAKSTAVRASLLTPAVAPVEGSPTDHRGVSWSPDGRWFTTPTRSPAGGLLLWDADGERPRAILGDRQVDGVQWSPDGSRLLAVTQDGRVLHWRLAEALQRAAIAR